MLQVICHIVGVRPLFEERFLNRDNEEVAVKKIGLWLKHGDMQFYVEATHTLAERIAADSTVTSANPSSLFVAHIRLYSRVYKKTDGSDGFMTDLTLKSIVPL